MFMAIIALLLFGPAGSVHFWEAWVFLGVLFIPMITGSIYFYRRDPALVERRMQTQEKEGQQKVLMKLAKFLWVFAYTIPGFDYRYGWTRLSAFRLPLWLIIVSQSLTLAGYLVTLGVMKANSFAASVVQVEAGQKVISTGPYAVVRHPMYSGAILMLVFMPLALGSFWALFAFLPTIPLIVWRLVNEEKVLSAGLPGYNEYRQQTRFRLLPGVW